MKKLNIILCLLLTITLAYSQNNWTESLTGFDTSYNPASVAIDNNNNLFLLGYKFDTNTNKYVSCLYKSTDNANSWTNITPTDLSNLGYAFSINYFNGKLIITGCNKNTSTGTIYISNNTTSNQNSTHSENILVYPNPVQDYLTIKTLNIQTSTIFIEIYDLQGNKFKNYRNSNGEKEHQLYLGNLSSGVFITRIRLDNKSYEYILIKK
jgi:hypothetical protein